MRIEKWSPESQFKNSKIVCRKGWIGIEGLPLNLWNLQVFRVIRYKCGGLLEIAHRTLQKTCLSHAVLKVQGDEGGFVQEKLFLSCWGKSIQVKIFSLNNRSFCSHGDKTESGSKTSQEEDDDVAVVLTGWL